MKKLVLLLLVILSIQHKSNAQDSLAANDPIVLQIQGLNFSQFIEQPVDTLLAHLPSGYTSVTIQGSVVAKKASYLVVKYAPYTYVCIQVRTFNYMNPNLSQTGDPYQNWNVNLFKKESIAYVVAFNGQCIKGCQDIFRFN
jgi:hypothetical protein